MDHSKGLHADSNLQVNYTARQSNSLIGDIHAELLYDLVSRSEFVEVVKLFPRLQAGLDTSNQIWMSQVVSFRDLEEIPN